MNIKEIVEGMTAPQVAQVIKDNFNEVDKDKANKTELNKSISDLASVVEANKTELTEKIDNDKDETDAKLSELGSEISKNIKSIEIDASMATLNTTCNFDVNYENFSISISSGYVFQKNNIVYNVSPHVLSFADNLSAKYIYFDTINMVFGWVDYVDEIQNNWLICGCINKSNTNVIINGLDLSSKKLISPIISRVDDIEKRVGGQTVTYPSDYFLYESFDVNLGGGSSNIVYFDTRYTINKYKILKSVSVKCASSGLLNIVFISTLDNRIVLQKPVSVVSGINKINIELDDSLYNEQLYVGLNSDGVYWNMNSNSPTTYNRKFDVSTGTITPISYGSAYSISYLDKKGELGEQVENSGVFYSIEDAIASGNNDIVLAPVDIKVKTPITLREGMTIRGSFGKTRLILTEGCKTAIIASNVNNIKISDIEIVGTCPTYNVEMNGVVSGEGYNLVETEDDALNMNYIGEERGIYLYYCENVVLENIKINHINGSGIRVNHVGMDYTRGLNAVNIFITNCYNGIYTENEHEFSQYSNFTITSCMIGIYISSGNLIFSAGHVTRCRVGIQIVDGYNTAHGIIQGVEVKHNQIYGILVNENAYGESFIGCYISYSNIKIRNSSGVTFDTIYMGIGIITSENTKGITGVNYIGKLFNRGNAVVEDGGNLVVGEVINLHN